MFANVLLTGKGLLCLVALTIGIVSVAVLELVLPGYAPKSVSNLVSKILNAYLLRRYTIKSADGDQDLPSCPYTWPNGQGDVGKFLEGIENSASWKGKHGAIYRIWAGMTSEVVLTRPSQLKSVFHDSDKHSKAINNNSGYLMSQVLGQCVGLISPPYWQKVRSIVELPFRHQLISLQTEAVGRQVEGYFSNLWKSSDLSRGLIHPAKDLKMLPFWVVCEIFYGQLPEDLLERLRRLAPKRERLMKFIIRGGLSRFTISKWMPTEANRALRDFKLEWAHFNRDVIHFNQTQNPSSAIVSMWQAVVRGEITEEQLLQTLDEALYANLDVTTGGLSWNLVFLAANQDKQEKLRIEINTMGGYKTVKEYLQSVSTFLHACILESSRLMPLAAFSVPQAAPTDRTVEGFIIPAHTNFIVDAYSMNIHNEYWSPNNTSYHPERFLEAKNSELRYLFWRFGFGPRQCMGKYAADLIIRTTLHHLIMNYELTMLESADSVWARDKESWITHPDFYVRCEKR